jgi:hypothetical protein
MTHPAHWTHDRDCFYKYMPANSASKVLQTSTLKWSRPSSFNDPFDVGFNLHLEYRKVDFAQRAARQIIELISERPPPLELARLLSARPDIPREATASIFGEAATQIIDHIEESVAGMHSALAERLSRYRILCLTSTKDNILMWSHYASNHTGVVLEFSCDAANDSPWSVARQVVYQSVMPSLATETELIGLLVGSYELPSEKLINQMIYTKAIDWAYEQEWRIHLPNDGLGEFVRFSPNELAGVYFGCRVDPEDRFAISRAAKLLNPVARLFNGKKSEPHFALEFVEIT